MIAVVLLVLLVGGCVFLSSRGKEQPLTHDRERCRRAMPRAERRLLGGAALTLLAAVALPALAQDRPESILPPGFDRPAPPPAAPPAATPGDPLSPTAPVARDVSPVDSAVVSTSALTPAELGPPVPPPPPPPEYPAGIRRDPQDAGVFDPQAVGLGARPWGGGERQISVGHDAAHVDTPLASRWTHIGLAQRADGARGRARRHDARRLGRRARLAAAADGRGRRCAVAGRRRSTPTASPPRWSRSRRRARSPTATRRGCARSRRRWPRSSARTAPLVRAMCASLSGSAETAAANIDQARRRGTVGGIDLALADKVVGAGADTARAVTIEWEPVTGLNAWRFGLATRDRAAAARAAGRARRPTLRAWLARSPMFPRQRAARTGAHRRRAGRVLFAAFVDLYAAAYDATDPDDLGQSDAWKLRLAYAGKDRQGAARRDARSVGQGDAEKRGAHRGAVLTARAATLVAPDAELAGRRPRPDRGDARGGLTTARRRAGRPRARRHGR